MLIGSDESDTCDGCGWINLVLRRRCRNCSRDLRQHLDPAIDREVRLDAEEGRRYERTRELRGDR